MTGTAVQQAGAAEDGFRHSQVQVAGSSLHVVEAGEPQAEPVLFLHGWPQSWRAWVPVMHLAAGRVRAIAIDLPGIGESTGDATDGTKRAVTEVVHGLAETLGLRNLTVVGHDAGAMVAYAYLRSFPEQLRAAVIMDVAVAGIPPWDQLTQGGGPWHFGFHAIPALPELLVQGHQREYFSFFYDALSRDPSAISQDTRAAYADAYTADTALTAGFNWYRTFADDAKHNQQPSPSNAQLGTPTLLLLSGAMAPMAPALEQGLRAAGHSTVTSAVLDQAGHFLPEEAPQQTWQLIANLIGL